MKETTEEVINYIIFVGRCMSLIILDFNLLIKISFFPFLGGLVLGAFFFQKKDFVYEQLKMRITP
ncbi:MAG: hypothetical protein C75L2_00560002 [Leptospirillum sp. Group II 'C75']|jgi:hypothetical protein|nr:hypothetical protein ABH19_06665 [Leptospirillum sp. Group II 'CF-1']EIJ76928.1 MAG: hypothetical protein C75L2_00560002 [Leptospirillum sp. Group II 'C75']